MPLQDIFPRKFTDMNKESFVMLSDIYLKQQNFGNNQNFHHKRVDEWSIFMPRI